MFEDWDLQVVETRLCFLRRSLLTVQMTTTWFVSATRDPSVLTELRQRYDLLRGDVTRTVTRTLPESRRQRLQVTEG